MDIDNRKTAIQKESKGNLFFKIDMFDDGVELGLDIKRLSRHQNINDETFAPVDYHSINAIETELGESIHGYYHKLQIQHQGTCEYGVTSELTVMKLAESVITLMRHAQVVIRENKFVGGDDITATFDKKRLDNYRTELYDYAWRNGYDALVEYVYRTFDSIVEDWGDAQLQDMR